MTIPAMTDLVTSGGPFRRYVLIGFEPQLAYSWLRARSIPRSMVVEVRGPTAMVRLRGESGQGMALVLRGALGEPGGPLPAQIGRLRQEGAVFVSPGWWPPR